MKLDTVESAVVNLKSALAALTQNATYTADVRLALSRIRQAEKDLLVYFPTTKITTSI